MWRYVFIFLGYTVNPGNWSEIAGSGQLGFLHIKFDGKRDLIYAYEYWIKSHLHELLLLFFHLDFE